MNEKQKDIALLVGLVLAGLSIVVAWGCNLTDSCTFGKYSGEVTLRSLETQQPLADTDVRTYIDFGGNPLIGSRTPYSTETDAQGQANVEFAKPFGSPLSIYVSAKPRGSNISFAIDSEDIGAQRTLLRSKPELINSGGEGDTISLELEINGWSLF